MDKSRHEGWINVYKHVDGDDVWYSVSSGMFPTREEAVKFVNNRTVATVKVDWEE